MKEKRWKVSNLAERIFYTSEKRHTEVFSSYKAPSFFGGDGNVGCTEKPNKGVKIFSVREINQKKGNLEGKSMWITHPREKEAVISYKQSDQISVLKWDGYRGDKLARSEAESMEKIYSEGASTGRWSRSIHRALEMSEAGNQESTHGTGKNCGSEKVNGQKKGGDVSQSEKNKSLR